MHAADRVRCVRDDVAAISVAIEAALENFPEVKLTSRRFSRTRRRLSSPGDDYRSSR
jgi:hypothetical protein